MEDTGIPRWRFLHKETNEVIPTATFIASFDTEPDILPMWVQYGDGAAGCMLGINSESISEPVCEIVYDEPTALKFTKETIAILKEHYIETDCDINFDPLFKYAAKNLEIVRYLYKSEHYKHEKEVRIVLLEMLSRTMDEDNLRVGEPFPRIFVELTQAHRIKEVVFGPKATGIDEMAIALAKRGIEKLSKSSIKFK